MAIATVTSNGQVTIPKEVRVALGIEAGMKVFFVRTPGGYVIKPANSSVMRLAGIVKHDGPAVSVEDMHAALLDGAAEDDARIKREWHR